MSEENVAGVLDPQELSSDFRQPAEPEPGPSAVAVAREEAAKVEAAEKPKILGFDTEEAAKAEFDRLKREHEEYNRKLEEYNRSARVQQAREQDEAERKQAEEAYYQQNARREQMLSEAARLNAAGRTTEAYAVMDRYNLENAAVLTKAMLDQALEPFKPLLTKAQAAESERSFMAHPDLQDIRHMSKQAIQLQQAGWGPEQIVPFLRSINEQTGGQRPKAEDADNDDRFESVPSLEDRRERTRREGRSLAPGGGGSAPRKPAATQEREAKERAQFFMEMYGPLAPKHEG